MVTKKSLQIKIPKETFHIAQVHSYNGTNQTVTAPKRKFKDGDWVKIEKLQINNEKDNK